LRSLAIDRAGADILYVSDSSSNDGAPAHGRRYHGRLDVVIDYVREHVHEPLTVERLSALACFSPYHFQRVFTATMGETVGAFVRRARLERATQLMKASPRRRLGSIAMEAGFGSFSDFSRAFRRHFGVTPSAWDRRSPPRKSTNRQANGAERRDLLAEWIAADDGAPPTATLFELPALTLAYVRVHGPTAYGALEKGYDALRRWLQERGLAGCDDGTGAVADGTVLLGMSWDDDELTPPELLRYDFAVSVSPGTCGGDGVAVRTVPPLRLVGARATGGLGRVARVWDFLYREWLPTSRWEPYHLPAFERYHRHPGCDGWDRWDVDCCIPLVPLRLEP
jgi:AraC family transcriptional regulator